MCSQEMGQQFLRPQLQTTGNEEIEKEQEEEESPELK